MRAFIAIPVPASISECIHSAVAPLRNAFPEVRWIPPENYHLTICFLGDITDDQHETLETRFANQLFAARPFEIEVSGFGFFPKSGRNIRVVHASVATGVQKCRALHNEVFPTARLVVPEIDQRFTPHLTLGRVRRKAPDTLRAVINDRDDTIRQRIFCNGFSIFESILSDRGAQYRETYRRGLV